MLILIQPFLLLPQPKKRGSNQNMNNAVKFTEMPVNASSDITHYHQHEAKGRKGKLIS